MAIHHIKWGDTLSALAAKYRTTVSKLAKLNNISNPDLIFAGRTLKLPGHDGRDGFDSPLAGRRGTGGAANTAGLSGYGGRGNGNLAENARRVALSMGGYNSQSLCATGVSRAIQNTYGIKVWGNGNQIDDNLPRDKFRQVNMSLEEALKIPGLILTWEKTSTRAGSIYGHTAITSGDGRSTYSDFIERNTLAAEGGRYGLKIFAPIT
ncbi:MAG TPA: LysM domain-containing protein [Myxococcaceae bacterium]|nr:LysM domain-containing protein [Myxococcaceae bacterium]